VRIPDLRSHTVRVKDSIQHVSEQIAAFLSNANEPAVVEPGQEPIPLSPGAYNIDLSGERLFFEAWTRERSLSRRITGVVEARQNRLQLSIEKFGKRQGVLELIDLSGPRSAAIARRASRQTYREQFRRSLLRQFPGWRVAELSTEPDLEHSLSPAYPRAALRKGAALYAAIGCPPDATDVEGVLTFGLIWLDYLRARETKLTVQGLAVFVPAGRHRSTCLRLLHLRPDRGEWSAFVYTDRTEDRADIRDYGNIDTVLQRRSTAPDSEQAWWTRQLSKAPFVTEREEPGGRVSFNVNGLEFARWQPGTGLIFGLETKYKGCESNLPEIEAIARELHSFRSAAAADCCSPLYLKKPELWLEAQVRSALRSIDAGLDTEPVYRQAPSFAGGERSVLDLLAVDHAGSLAVVEVKASEDLHLPLQALDYWIRVRWHALRDDFSRLGYFPGKSLRPVPPRLLLVAPALCFHPTTEALVEYLSPEAHVDIIGLGMDWRNQVKVMFRRTRAVRPS
jgi:hypothetical protein